jgi:hypothetical protein
MQVCQGCIEPWLSRKWRMPLMSHYQQRLAV